MSTISTHVLDTAKGAPAGDMAVTLEKLDAGTWHAIGLADTNPDGRIADFAVEPLVGGTYRLRFDTGRYQRGFYPEVVITFNIVEGQHYHVPLLLSPFGYSTYRGS